MKIPLAAARWKTDVPTGSLPCSCAIALGNSYLPGDTDAKRARHSNIANLATSRLKQQCLRPSDCSSTCSGPDHSPATIKGKFFCGVALENDGTFALTISNDRFGSIHHAVGVFVPPDKPSSVPASAAACPGTRRTHASTGVSAYCLAAAKRQRRQHFVGGSSNLIGLNHTFETGESNRRQDSDHGNSDHQLKQGKTRFMTNCHQDAPQR
ncbi:hypothetical protein CFBP2533_25960 [Xanthomonas hortorum pv. pelargonii]|uniref:Uncharacterized protein n=1 Tax=Xanthomonas hortorum pv. pelargonii TaxID=453602 RepID=A0A6V7DPI5_9XANT|nr:hypothetical protein CFBP2533_25960 [Xanthomonas hortorum pv. pelargonii]CAD0338156.1 hypothetical protein CFBP2533_25960 [Xanthomonas hortorum pv. pelargonii]